MHLRLALASLVITTVQILNAQIPTALQLQTPVPPAPNPTTGVIGNTGSTAYVYYVIANYPGGTTTSQPVTTAQAPNTLSGSNYVNVGWQPIAGVSTYDVLRLLPGQLFTGTCTCAVSTGLTVTNLNDTGSALTSYTIGAQAVSGNGTFYVNNILTNPPKMHQVVNGVDAPIGGSGTIPITSSALKGDGAGNAAAVTGSGSNCVHVDGTSASCSGVAGADTALDNLSAVNINTSLLAQAGVDNGSVAKPFRNLFLYGAGTFGSTSFEITGTPTAARTWTLLDASDIFVGIASAQTLTNKTFVAPVLGTPASGNASNLTNIPVANATGLLPIANGGTGTATPGLVQGTNVTITGSWPNQTINSSGGGGSTSVTLTGTANQVTLTGTCSSSTSVTCSFSLPANLIFPGTAQGTSFTTSNSGIGGIFLMGQGTVPTQTTTANSWGWIGPTTLTTPWFGTPPNASPSANNVMLFGAPGGSNVSTWAWTGISGSGPFCMTTGCTMTTPALGTPASGNASNMTNIPVNQAVGNLPVANLNGGTGASNTTFWRGDGSWQVPSGGGGGGGGAPNPACTFSATAIGCTSPINVASLNVPNANYSSIVAQCWTGASTTQTALPILTYVYVAGATYVSTVAPTFSAASAAGYCTANLTSGAGAAGSAGVVQGSNGSGGLQTTSATDNGTTFAVTEPVDNHAATTPALVPVIAGASANAAGKIAYDSTNLFTHVATSGADSQVNATLASGSFTESKSCTTSSAASIPFTSNVTIPANPITQLGDVLQIEMDYSAASSGTSPFVGFDIYIDGGAAIFTMAQAPSGNLQNGAYQMATWTLWPTVVAAGANSTVALTWLGGINASTSNATTRLLYGAGGAGTLTPLGSFNLGITHTIGLQLECTSATGVGTIELRTIKVSRR